MKLDAFEKAMAEMPEPEEAPMRHNRRMPPQDLMLAQLHRRLQLATQPDEEEEEKTEAAIEFLVGLVVLGIVCTFILLVWWYRS